MSEEKREEKKNGSTRSFLTRGIFLRQTDTKATRKLHETDILKSQKKGSI